MVAVVVVGGGAAPNQNVFVKFSLFARGLSKGLRVRVYCREFYREYLATIFRRESNSWQAGSLRLRCNQRAGENSQSTKFSLTCASDHC
jgi:hypothetical protein